MGKNGTNVLGKNAPEQEMPWVYFTWRNVVNVKKQNGLSSDLFSEKTQKNKKQKKKKQRAVFMGKLKR